MEFQFQGEISASKSILNRLLVIQSFASGLTILGDSRCDDVLKMKSALPRVMGAKGEPADCGAAGTTFRFLTVRASRLPGRHLLTGTQKLLDRPQEALVSILRDLGVKVERTAQGLELESAGWKNPGRPLRIDRSQSSQFASAVLLSAWDLDFDLDVEFTGIEDKEAPSEGYLEMTVKLVEQAGLEVRSSDKGFRVSRGSKVKAKSIRAETDLSSAFAIAALAAVAGRAVIEEFPEKSLQPDAVFPEILKAMGAGVRKDGTSLIVEKARELRAVEWNLRDCPDLFPVLATVCAQAKGRSRLFGAPHLAHKESSRIESTARLLRELRTKFESKPDGMEVEGGPISSRAFDFDPEHDHRLAMAAAVARAGGASVNVLDPRVVDKSFPEFWQILERGLTSKRSPQ